MGKSFIRAVVNAARADRLSYPAFIRETAAARTQLGLTRPSRGRRLPSLLTQAELARFYSTIDSGPNLCHQIMLRLLLFTGVRVSELTHITIADVDLDASRIYIASGKGDKDRYVLFPDTFKLTLKVYMASVPENRFLFESRLKNKFTPRQIQRIVREYAEQAELPRKVHPHLFRHQLLTWLTAQGMTDAQIQLVSGHSSKKSLEVYQHIGLGDAAPGYQEAVKKLPKGV